MERTEPSMESVADRGRDARRGVLITVGAALFFLAYAVLIRWLDWVPGFDLRPVALMVLSVVALNLGLALTVPTWSKLSWFGFFYGAAHAVVLTALLHFLGGTRMGAYVLVYGFILLHPEVARATSPFMMANFCALCYAALAVVDWIVGQVPIFAAPLTETEEWTLVILVWLFLNCLAIFADQYGRQLRQLEEVRERRRAEEALLFPDPRSSSRRGRDVIAQRLARVSGPCRQVLTLGSVAGEQFGLDVLERASDLPREDLLPLLDEAIRAGIVKEAMEAIGQYRFSHGLIREALYEELSKPRRIQFHHKVAKALEGLHEAAPDKELGEIAYHLCRAVEGGTAAEAVCFSIRAGDRAAERMAHEEARGHYERALEASAYAPASTMKERCELLIKLSDARWRVAEFEKAKNAAAQAIELARHLHSADHLASAALSYAGRLQMFGAVTSDDAVVAALQEVLDTSLECDSRLRAAVMARLAEELALCPDESRRWDLARGAIEAARQAGDHRLLASVLRAAFWAYWVPEETDRRFTFSAEMLQIAEWTGDRVIKLDGLLSRLWPLFERGDVRNLQHEIEACARLAEDLRAPYQQWVVATARACLALAEGRLASAASLANDALELGQRHHIANAPLCFGVQTAHLFWLQGRLQEVEATLPGFKAAYPLLAPMVHCSLAITYSEQGREKDARRELQEIERCAGLDYSGIPRSLTWLPSIAFLSEVCADLGDADRAARLYELLAPFAGRTILLPPVVVFGPASHYLGQLAATMELYEDAERHFRDALELSESMGSRQWRARTQVAYVRLLQRQGRPEDQELAAELLEQAIAIAEELDMPVLVESARVLGRRGKELMSEPAPTVGREDGLGPQSQADRATFRRQGDHWTLIYGDVPPVTMRHLMGLHYIAQLLRQPETWIEAREVKDEGSSLSGDSNGLDISDKRALADFNKRLKEIEEEIQEAEQQGDSETVEKLLEEKESIRREISRVVDWRGRIRMTGSENERARQAVTHAIGDALKRIGKVHPLLRDHLKAAIKTGKDCGYFPRSPIVWEL